MDRYSVFIKDKALFGGFPTQEIVDILENNGVRYFIDLTEPGERNIVPYTTKYTYIKYPIPDHDIPHDWVSFAQLVLKILDFVLHYCFDGTKVLINCKGGHARSSLVVACILSLYHQISPSEALRKTAQYHSERVIMREKWRKMASPHGKKQRDFVYRFLRPLRYSIDTAVSSSDPFTHGLHNFSNHRVYIPKIGMFPNAYLAFQAYRNLEDSEYIFSLQTGRFCPELAKNYDKKKWEENKVQYMYQVLEYKFRQHIDLKISLMNTGLRTLIKISKDSFWGCGRNYTGKNIHGKLLWKLREKFLREDMDNGNWNKENTRKDNVHNDCWDDSDITEQKNFVTEENKNCTVISPGKE